MLHLYSMNEQRKEKIIRLYTENRIKPKYGLTPLERQMLALIRVKYTFIWDRY